MEKDKNGMLYEEMSGESSVVMSEFPTESIHLCVTSPSYPMIEKWDEMFGCVDFARQHAFLSAVWTQVYRVLVDGGMCCINIGDATRRLDNKFQCFPNYAKVVMDCVSIGFTPLIPIFWKKISNRPNAFLGSGFVPTSGYISQDHEYIALLRKGGPRKFPPNDPNRYASAFTKEERDLWFQQIWKITGAKGAKETSSFPEEVPHRLIRMFSVIGDIVLDPFSGGGITGEAAGKLDRGFIGIDYGYTRSQPIERIV